MDWTDKGPLVCNEIIEMVRGHRVRAPICECETYEP